MTKPNSEEPRFKVGDIVEITPTMANVEDSWGLIGVVKRVDPTSGYIYANAIVKPERWKFHDFCCPSTSIMHLRAPDET